MALYLHNPAVYLTLGTAWAFGLLARLYSMLADNTSVQASLPGIVVDTVMAALSMRRRGFWPELAVFATNPF